MRGEKRDRVFPWRPCWHRARQGMAVLVFAGMILSACSREEGRPIPEATVHSLVVGKTTEREVLKRLGAPEKKTRLLGEDVWIYRHVKSHGFMSVHTSSKTLRLRFDDREVLQNIDRRHKKANAFF